MKKVYRYTRKIFLADSIKRDRPISILEFDTINEKIRASYKEKTSENFLFSSPEKMKELPSERAAKVEIIVKADSIEEALFRSEKVLEEKMAILTFLSFYPVKFLDSGSIRTIRNTCLALMMERVLKWMGTSGTSLVTINIMLNGIIIYCQESEDWLQRIW